MEMKEPGSISSLASLGVGEFRGPDGPVPSRFLADSRLVRKGDAFVAFRGETTDGHSFIPDAVSRGASLILCEDRDGVPESTASIRVENMVRDLPEMARRRLEAAGGMELVAVTGSVGKTTTREMLRNCLATSFRVHAAEHSYNTLIGCALAVLSLPPGTDILILEMGTSHPGEIRETVKFFPPTIALVTEVAEAHLEGLGSLEGVLDAKLEIAESPRLKAFFFNGDNPSLLARSASLPSSVLRFSVGKGENDFRIQNPEYSLHHGASRLAFDFSYPGGMFSVISGLFGIHSAYPLGFALAVSFYLGASRDRVAEELEKLVPIAGRGRTVELPSGILLIDDAYNANPASMRASLAEVARLPGDRKVAVLGEMRELGERSLSRHGDMVPLFRGYRRIYLTGEMWKRYLDERGDIPDAMYVDDLEALGRRLRAELERGDVLLVKGSHGNRLDRLVTFLEKGETR